MKINKIHKGELRMTLTRNEIMKVLAEKYCYFLNTLRFEDSIYMAGMSEARRKFLGNTHFSIVKNQLPKKYKDWRFSSDFVSERALEHLKKGNWESNTLQYDHMVPKTKHIIKICEDAAKNGTVSTDFVFNILSKYLWVATIHRDEDALMGPLGLRNKMPLGWDKENIFARYELAGIKVMEHDKAYFREAQISSNTTLV